MNINSLINILNTIGLSHDDHLNRKGWLLCECGNPSHDDKVMNNCSVNIDTLVMNCLSCGYSKHIINVLMDNLNIPFVEAKKIVEQDNFVFFQPDKTVVKNISRSKEKKKKSGVNKKYSLLDFDPTEFEYTRLRGYTKRYLMQNYITLCISNPYVDYMCIPIMDTVKDIYEYEFRKLKQHEYLQKYYNDFTSSPDCLAELFKHECETEGYRLNKHYDVITNKNKKIFNLKLKYLLQPKTLYVYNSRLTETLFNIDRLNYNESLYICEGTASLARISQVSKNCTCLFGSKPSEAQIEYLNKFEDKKIIISDHDKASYIMIENLYRNVKDVYVADILTSDEDESFVEDLKNCNLVEGFRFLLNKII